MSKDKFYKIILEEMQRRFIGDKNKIISKIITLIAKERIKIS